MPEIDKNSAINFEIDRILSVLHSYGLVAAEIEFKNSTIPEINWRGFDYRAELLLKSKEFFDSKEISCEFLDRFVYEIRIGEAKGVYSAFEELTEKESLEYLEWLDSISNWRRSSLIFCLTTGSTKECSNWMQKPPLQDEAVAKYPYHHRAWDIVVIIAIIGLALILWNILP